MASSKVSSTTAAADDDALLAKAKRDWQTARAHRRKWVEEAREDFAFVAGDQWSDEDRLSLERQRRAPVSFNRIGPMIAAVAGAEVQNRQEVSYVPRRVGDAAVSDALTAAAKYFRGLCDAEDEESSAFRDCLICGEGWTETYMDHSENPDGSIIIESVDPMEIVPDPRSRKRNYADARFVFRRKDMTRGEIEDQWPGAFDLAAAIVDETGGDWGWGWGWDETLDSDPHETLPGRQYELGKGKSAGEVGRRKLYPVVEYQYKEHAPVYRMVDPATGQEAVFEERRWRKLEKAFKALGGGMPPAVKQKRTEVRRAWFLGSTVLEDDTAPCPTTFSYKAITGVFARNERQWYGVTRCLKDPQRWANKFFSQVLHIINTNAKGGVIAEADAVEDVRDFEEDWARADSVVWLRNGGIGRVMPKPISGVPQDIPGMMQFCVAALRECSGINLELLGMAESVQPGVLEYQRRQTGLMVLATVFDGLRRYRKEQGRLLLYMIQEYVPDQTLIRVEGPQGAQYVPLMKQGATAQFDVIVDEAPSSPNLKEQVFGVLQTLAPQLQALGLKLPLDTLDYLPLPDSLIQAIREANGQQEGQQQDPQMALVQQQMQLDAMKAQAQQQLDQAKLKFETELQQAKLLADHQAQQRRLELDQHVADTKAQTDALAQMIKAMQVQAQTAGALPGDVARTMQMLQDTVVQQHEQLQGLAGQHADLMAKHAQAQQQLQQALAPKEVVRDETGRIVGVRVAGGGQMNGAGGGPMNGVQ